MKRLPPYLLGFSGGTSIEGDPIYSPLNPIGKIFITVRRRSQGLRVPGEIGVRGGRHECQCTDSRWRVRGMGCGE